MSGLGLLRGRVAALGTVIIFVLAAGTWISLTHASAKATPGRPGAEPRASASPAPAGPLRVLSVTPAAWTWNANGGAPVRVVFSAALAASSPLPSLSPSISGSWQRVSADTVQFVPRRGFAPHTRVRLRIPGGAGGVRPASGSALASSVTVHYRTGTYALLRLDQLLAQLGYLPVTWTAADAAAAPAAADASAQRSAAYSPPAGAFTWNPGYPWKLHSFWRPGQAGSLIRTGAVMAFESDRGMTMDGVVGPGVWKAVLAAVAAGQANTHGYTYALARQASPETLTVWHNGRVVLRSAANTGIPVAPTTIGTAPVYLRYQSQIMRGTNPDGSKYADPVNWVAYFRAGEAVHYFPRGSYGYPQSLGCVELPWAAAEKAWPYLTYGTLVTVAA